MLLNPDSEDAWEQCKLGQTLDFLKDGTHGTHKDADIGPLLLSAKNIKNGTIEIDRKSERIISQKDYDNIHSTFSLKRNDVLLTIVGTIGECAILKDPDNITFQRSVAFLRPNIKLDSSFLYTIICNGYFQQELEKRKSVSAQPGIYLGELADINICMPSVSEQKQIGTLYTEFNNLITLHQ